ncbi:putative zinc-binding protein [Desulfovirgula thermocuniculi]|uniref:putative zinc-binding protein n=1 Tax=Desulfovirgula thermocuniculi TaxID=348842 RepID=UPI0003FA977B|nr:putative zinc-binding protein [Desulfovirgula thermocuniculi]
MAGINTCTCTCEGGGEKVILLFPCSGASNVGQLTNQAAIELTREGVGKMYCLAGIGGRLEGFINTAKGADAVVAIDGCPAACARATLEGAGVPIHHYFMVTEMGIKKTHTFDLKPEDIALVCRRVKEALTST